MDEGEGAVRRVEAGHPPRNLALKSEDDEENREVEQKTKVRELAILDPNVKDIDLGRRVEARRRVEAD